MNEIYSTKYECKLEVTLNFDSIQNIFETKFEALKEESNIDENCLPTYKQVKDSLSRHR